MSTLTQFGGGNPIGSIVPGLFPGNPRFLACDGVSTAPVTSANSSLAKIYPSVTSATGSYLISNFQGFHAYSITYGAGVWVAVGAGSINGSGEVDTIYALSSTDLVNWTPRPLPMSAVWRSIAWNGSRFVAVGTDAANTAGYAASSTDGMNWFTANIPSGVQYKWVIAAGGRFFAFANNGSSAYYSEDGLSWVGAGSLSGINASGAVAFKGRVFIHNSSQIGVKVGGPSVSSSWTAIASGTSLTFIAASPTTLVVTSGVAGQTRTSTDGVNFTAQASAPVLYSAIWDGSVFIGFGASNNLIYTSPDGATWTLKTGNIYLSTMTRMVGASDGTNTVFVDYANGTTQYQVTTNSATSVTQRPFPKSGFVGASPLGSAAYSSTLGMYVIGGASDNPYEPIPVIMTSTDLVNWTERAVEMPAWNSLGSGSNIRQIVWTGTAFIATNSTSGSSIVHVSTDGINWRYRTGAGSGLPFLVFGAGRVLLVYTDGSYYSSTDNGNTWTGPSGIGGGSLIGVAFNGTTFMAMNSSGGVYTSTTGTGSWTIQAGAPAGTYFSVGAVGTAFVATVGGSVTNFYYNTTNGSGSWTSRSMPLSLNNALISSDGANMVLSSNVASGSQFLSFTNPAGTLTTVNTVRLVSSSTNAPVAVYLNGNLLIPSSNTSIGAFCASILVSTNGGTSWSDRSLYTGWNTIISNNSSVPTNSVTFGGKAYFTTRYRPVVWSTEENNTTLKARVLPLGSVVGNGAGTTYTAIGSNGTILVALGFDANNSVTVISTSTDGNNWVLRTTPAGIPTTGMPSIWTNIVWNGSLFLATSNTHVGMTSPDGITWTVQQMPTNETIAGMLTWGAGSFFLSASGTTGSSQLGGYAGYYTSTNGVTWTLRSSPIKSQISGVGLYFASDGTQVMMMPHVSNSNQTGVQYWTTTDGTNWTRGQICGYGSALVNSSPIVTSGTTFFVGNMASFDGKYWFNIGNTFFYPIPVSNSVVFGFTPSGGTYAVVNVDANTIKSPALNSTSTLGAPFYALSLVVA